MKKLFLLLAFFGTFALTTATAQTASTDATSTEMTAADKAAATDAAIISETCAHSGTVSYYRTAADKGGAISKVKVNFDAATGTFVSAKKKAACSAAEKASCAKGQKAAKGCCSGKKKSSCSKKTK